MLNLILTLSTFLFIFLFPFKVQAGLYINEVFPEPELPNKKWVEIYNDDSETSQDLSEYIITNTYEGGCESSDTFEVFEFPPDSEVEEFEDFEINSLYMKGDIVLYLFECANEEILKDSLYIPSQDDGQNKSIARIFDGSSDIEVRSGSEITRGSTNNTKPLIFNPQFNKSEYSLGEDIKLTFDLKANTANFDGFEIYINDFLVHSNYNDNPKENYSITLEDIEKSVFFSGTNLLKVVAIGKSTDNSEVIKPFIVKSNGPVITFDTLHNNHTSDSVSISGVVSSNSYLTEILFFSKKKDAQNFPNEESQSLKISQNSLKRKDFNFSFSPSEEGEYNIKVAAKDDKSSSENVLSESIYYDSNAPSVEIILNPEKPNGKNDYFVKDVSIGFEPKDSDISRIYYKWNDEEWALYKEEFKALEGDNDLYYKSVDKLGNESSEVKKSIKVDTVLPNVSVDLFPKYPDGLNGFYLEEPQVIFSSYSNDISKYEYSFDNEEWVEYDDNLEFKDLFQTIYYRAVDKAGNVSKVKEFDYKIAYEKPSTIRSIDYKFQSDGSLLITWEDYDKEETYFYEIYRSQDPNLEVNKDTFYIAVPVGDESYLDKSLTPGETYYYLLVKKAVSGKSSDPVRFSVTASGRVKEVLGMTRKISPAASYLGPIQKQEKFTAEARKGEIKGVQRDLSKHRIIFFTALGSVFVAFYNLRKLNLLNAS